MATVSPHRRHHPTALALARSGGAPPPLQADSARSAAAARAARGSPSEIGQGPGPFADRMGIICDLSLCLRAKPGRECSELSLRRST